ncbi:hypothetical protein EST38_g9176 [Candolleomyces aberdarensis]|uniref:Uncharacterized protein n=1 Tax=Candolleomyces aberdarensis TaxID=2316362 RepID=A0A4Q2DAL5_9AGAR|nr:hypothetical protein EST38_g9176 [Candolleomyces aberdarensis]
MTLSFDHEFKNVPSHLKIAGCPPKPATAQDPLSAPSFWEASERVPTSAGLLKLNQQLNNAPPQVSASTFFPSATGCESIPEHGTGEYVLINPWAGVITRPCTFVVSLRTPARPCYPPQFTPAPFGGPLAQPWLQRNSESGSNPRLAHGSAQPPHRALYGHPCPLNSETSASEIVSDTPAGKFPMEQPVSQLPTMQELQEEGYPEEWKSDDGAPLVPIDLAHFDAFCLSLIDGSFFENEAAQAREEFRGHTLN